MVKLGRSVRRFLGLLLSSVVVLGPYMIVSAATNEAQQLPFCGNVENQSTDDTVKRVNRDAGKKLIYVTTLDGHLSALNLANNGRLEWDIETGPGELLSSSIQNLELTNNGQVVRIIPALSGSLYQLTGRTVEAIPITAENLLSLSYKFSDDLVISGGKDTRSYGVTASNGKVMYECTMTGCKNESTLATAGERNVINELDENGEDASKQSQRDYREGFLDDVVVIRRQTQTVRAIDPRTGVERWNFSVGNHELEILTQNDCHLTDADSLDFSDIDLRVVVPEGLLCAYSKKTSALLWQHKFDFPIVNAWRFEEGKLAKVDLFQSLHWMYDKDTMPNYSTITRNNPAIYVGLFNKQLYVQESESMLRRYQEYITKKNQDLLLEDGMSDKPLSLPWKPLPAIKTDLMTLDIEQQQQQQQHNKELHLTQNELMEHFAIQTINNPRQAWDANKGFFLFDDDPPNRCSPAAGGNETQDDKETPDASGTLNKLDETVKITFVSMWYWWKEMLVITLTSTLVLHLFINTSSRKRMKARMAAMEAEKENVVVERYIEIPIPVEKTPTATNSNQSVQSQLSILGTSSNSSPNFGSRFLSDFDMIQCLGKGGFGVVFEAKNKLDDCRYAVKRIVLPTRQENRERVMREVKTLANCEHQNIVRFFQAWVEQPPPGWQEEQDRFWLSHQDSIMSTSIEMETSGPQVRSFNSDDDIHTNRVLASPGKGIFTELNTNECLSLDEERMRKTTFVTRNEGWSCSSPGAGGGDSKWDAKSRWDDLADGDDDDDSFIEFKHSTNNNNEEDYVPDDLNGNCCRKSESDSVFSNSHSAGSHKVNLRERSPHLALDMTDSGRDRLNGMSPLKNQRMYLYIQMQLCQKQSLKEWLQLTPQAERREKIVPIFDQIIGAVEYVHLKGLIHRDLKPSNIFFALDGTVKIGDFGLVTDMEEPASDEDCEEAEEAMPACDTRPYETAASPWSPGERHLKRHTEQVGTHLYMSPEQVEGRAYDYKVDIYSLGLILFELLVVFATEMERIKTLTSLRQNHFPVEYLSEYTREESDLLKIMLSKYPRERPTTFGIRARPPLNYNGIKADHHFEMPSRRKHSKSVSLDLNN